MSKTKVAMLGFFENPTKLEEDILGTQIDKYEMGQKNNAFDIQKLLPYEGFLMWHDCRLTSSDIVQLKNLKAVVRIGMGYDNVDIKSAGENHIMVSNVPDYGTEEVADSAISLMLMLLRKTFQFACSIKYDNMYIMANQMKGARRVSGKILGIVGFGNIGKCVAQRAKGFGLSIQFFDPYVPHGIDKALGCKRLETLDELLTTSDIVSVNCWLSDETRYLINKVNIKKMKKGSFLINTARGPIIQEEALVDALATGHLAGAGLDVLEVEPYNDGHLSKVPNLIITPHSAFYSEEGFIEMREKAAQELKRMLSGEKPKYCVNTAFLK